jgi:4-hydroxy-3-methylbut-2-enyl diphosphate reductase
MAAPEGDGLLVFCALGIEARPVRAGARGARVVRTGMGPKHAERAAAGARETPARALAVSGLCGGLVKGLVPGEIIVATEIQGPGKTIQCPEAEGLAAVLRRAGLLVRADPVVSVDHIVRGEERAHLADRGAVAVDMESFWLAEAARDRPFVVARAVLDTPEREILHPVATTIGGIRAYRALKRTGGALADWAAGLDT